MNSRAVSKDWSIQENHGSRSRGRKADRGVIFSFRGQSSGNLYVGPIFTVDHTSDPEGQGQPALQRKGIVFRRRSRERRSPVSEIVTDTPTICQRDTGQRGRSAMDTPHHEGTPYLIEVTSRPGKYELLV